MFYTYAHYTPQGRLFYIGKGQGDRAHTFYQRGIYWKNIVQKYGNPNIEILANWDVEQDAFDHEKFLISCFKDMGYKLANLTDGGEGTSGYKHTAKQRENNRRARLGKPVWNIGIPCKEETKIKISVVKTGSIPWNKGISSGLKHTEEFKEKIRRTHTGSKYNLGRPTSAKQKAIASALSKGNKYATGNTAQRKWIWVGTNILTGEVVKFIGEQALKEAGIQHANVIKCINGDRKSHKGYTWHKEPWENK
jgi:hypothetical protein